MNDPKHTIRIKMTDIFREGAFVPARDVRAACEKVGVTMEVIEEKYFEFSTDDVRNLFLLGLNFPRA